jgi:hypothetical protein
MCPTGFRTDKLRIKLNENDQIGSRCSHNHQQSGPVEHEKSAHENWRAMCQLGRKYGELKKELK